MSQASMVAPGARSNREIVNETVVDDSEVVQKLLDALDDSACRCILDAASDEALTANEVSETCDLPTSTAYRKLELLEEAGLVAERIRIRLSGKHASEYRRAVDDVVVSVDASGGMELRLVDRSRDEDHVSVTTEE